MHDPMAQALSIRRPWPQIRRLPQDRNRDRSFSAAFWRFRTFELYWPGLVTVWHVEPNDADAGTVCKPSTWKRHVHHWRLQIHPLQHFRRWAFTRCTWCGGRSRRGDYINVSSGWGHDSKPRRWWQGEVGLFHADCSSISHAHRTCVCSLAEGGPWDRGVWSEPHGTCATCGGFRSITLNRHESYEVLVQTTAMYQAVPEGHRAPEVTAAVKRIWRERRAALEKADRDAS